ncbi:MAG: biosynthetic-type acetolactate synthase large subunit [Nitrososphaerota archaeon]|nr:biosynthetic-type acetolactate synthase large subunit [Candidatus Calditenuaceae archaeon]MDW8073319.1 biosynthetic-type acetolactate synthase large subunit [Nitrososphaerota archaeon]
MKASDALVRKMEELGVEYVFGIPGGANLPLYDSLYDSNIRSVLVKHEQQAVHAAEGYARVKKRPGVALATSGPGATNLITGLVNAAMDSSPLVAITGQVVKSFMGTDAFQESDIVGMVLPHIKYATVVTDSSRLIKEFVSAFECAISGRPGPALLDIPRDVQQEDVGEYGLLDDTIEERFIKPAPNPDEALFKRAAELLADARRVCILIGGGAYYSDATGEALKLAEILNAAVIATTTGKTAVDESHPNVLGVVGMHGRFEANLAVIESDLVLCVGTRLSDRSIGPPTEFRKNRRIIHIDIDASEIGKNVMSDVGIVCQARLALAKILEHLTAMDVRPKDPSWVLGLKEIGRSFDEYMFSGVDGSRLSSWKVVKLIREELPRSAIVTTGVGQHQMWAQLFFKILEPGTFITSAGLGTMGFGLPAAMGAKAAAPDRIVLNMDGDGSFLMTCQALGTIVEYDLPVITVIFDNRALGMVRQWQDLFYKKRFKDTDLEDRTNLLKLSEAFGVEGVFVESYEELRSALRRAIRNNDAIVIDVPIEKSEKVFPMVPPGRWLADVILPPGFSEYVEEKAANSAK